MVSSIKWQTGSTSFLPKNWVFGQNFHYQSFFQWPRWLYIFSWSFRVHLGPFWPQPAWPTKILAQLEFFLGRGYASPPYWRILPCHHWEYILDASRYIGMVIQALVFLLVTTFRPTFSRWVLCGTTFLSLVKKSWLKVDSYFLKLKGKWRTVRDKDFLDPPPIFHMGRGHMFIVHHIC